MNITQKYNEIINALKNDQRYLSPLTQKESVYLENELTNIQEKEWEKLFCILINTQTRSLNFKSPLLKLLKNESLPAELIVFVLEACGKHIIEASQIKGERIPQDFLDELSPKLFHSSPEVVEWTLRVIEQCGQRSIMFRSDLQKIKPGFFKILKPEFRIIRQLIDFMEIGWLRIDQLKKR